MIEIRILTYPSWPHGNYLFTDSSIPKNKNVTSQLRRTIIKWFFDYDYDAYIIRQCWHWPNNEFKKLIEWIFDHCKIKGFISEAMYYANILEVNPIYKYKNDNRLVDITKIKILLTHVIDTFGDKCYMSPKTDIRNAYKWKDRYQMFTIMCCKGNVKYLELCLEYCNLANRSNADGSVVQSMLLKLGYEPQGMIEYGQLYLDVIKLFNQIDCNTVKIKTSLTSLRASFIPHEPMDGLIDECKFLSQLITRLVKNLKSSWSELHRKG